MSSRSTRIDDLVSDDVPEDAAIRDDDDDLVSIQETLDQVQLTPEEEAQHRQMMRQTQSGPSFQARPAPTPNMVIIGADDTGMDGLFGFGAEYASAIQQPPTIVRAVVPPSTEDNSIVRWIRQSFTHWRFGALTAVVYVFIAFYVTRNYLSSVGVIPTRFVQSPAFILMLRASVMALAVMLLRSAFP